MPSPEAITETVKRYLALVASGTADACWSPADVQVL